QRLHFHLRLPKDGDDNDRDVRVRRNVFAQLLENLDSGKMRHLPIEQNEVWLKFHEPRQGASRIGNEFDLAIAVLQQDIAEQSSRLRLVIDDEDATAPKSLGAV